MGRWQERLKTLQSSPLQNLQNTVIDCSVGSVGTQEAILNNKERVHSKNSEVRLANDGVFNEHNQCVNGFYIPVHHYSEPQYGDTDWITLRLKMVASHKRELLAAEYSEKYQRAFDSEINEIRKENAARRYANSWLLRVTSRQKINV